MVIKKNNCSFYIGEKASLPEAIIEYQLKEKILYATKTYVSENLRNQGIAKKLLDKLVEYARQNKYKIFPVCIYVTKSFERLRIYDDVKTNEGDMDGISANCRIDR